MTLKEGQSITRPPLLEGSNYATWKPVMRSFLKSLDERAWKVVLRGWTEPTMNNLTGEPVPKPEALCTEDEDKASMGNSKAMNAIFSTVNENVMKLIINCEVTKEAWDILQTAFEGTDKVRNSRMQAVTTKFEEMKMKEDENISEYNTRVLELSNEASALGKPIDEERLASKILRSLPPRFAMKVTAIEEMHDITKLKLDELMGSLRTYEINRDFQTSEQKGIALKADMTEDKLDAGCTTEQLAMMAQNFGRMVRKINRRGPEQGQSSSTGYRNWKSSRPRSSDSRQDSPDKGKEEIQCHECKGFGHIASQCANTLMKRKAMVASFSDSESDEEKEEGETTNFVAFTATLGECSSTGETVPSQQELPAEYPSDSDDEELTQESLAQTYKDLYGKWLQLVKINKKLNDTIASISIEKEKVWQEVEILLTQKEELECTVDSLNTQLTEIKQEKVDLLAQRTELLGTVSSLKVEMDYDTHPGGMTGLRKTITDLKQKEVFQLRRVEQLELQLESEKMDHSDMTEELNHLKQSVRMLNSGTKNLNAILRSQGMESGHRGLGFTGEGSSKGTMSTKARPVSEQKPEHKVRQHPRQKVDLSQDQSKGNSRSDHKEIQRTLRGGKTRGTPVQRRDFPPVRPRGEWRTCWYCNQMGHIKLKCRLFLSERRAFQQRTTSQQKQVWVQKADRTICMVACYTSNYSSHDNWLFDSGCSAHMTGNSQYLTHIRPVEHMWFVTFGDGEKGQVIGCGTLMVPDLPALKNTLLVKGLPRNLISISQLCDDGHYVSFSSYSCLVLDQNGDTLMKGKRDANNCYTIRVGLTESMNNVHSHHGQQPVALPCAYAQPSFLRGGVEKTLHIRSDCRCAQIKVTGCPKKLLNQSVVQLQKKFVHCTQECAWPRTRKYKCSRKMVTLRQHTCVKPYGRSQSETPRSPGGLCGVNH
ncbi:unnamed protein product [Rhodiola kirilowii]